MYFVMINHKMGIKNKKPKQHKHVNFGQKA